MKITICPWLRRAVSIGLLVAVMSSSSLIGLAVNDQPLMGELIVSGTTDGQPAVVTVNGERASTGRTVFSSNVITTSSTASATINLGKSGRIELAPNSSLKLDFSDKAILGDLTGGQIKVMNAAEVDVKIQTKDGVVSGELSQSNLFVVNAETSMTDTTAEIGTVYLNNGKSITKAAAPVQDDDSGFGKYAGPIALGAIALLSIIVITTIDDDDEVVSPTR